MPRRLGALVRSNRFSLTGALLLGLVLPLTLFHFMSPWLLAWPARHELYPSFAVVILSVIETHVLLRKVGEAPLIDGKVIVLPSTITIYCINTLFVEINSIELSHQFVFASFALTFLWYIFIAAARARLTFPRLAYVGGLPNDVELLSRRIEWVPLNSAALPHDVVGIVFNSAAPLAQSVERLLCRAALRHIPIYEIDHFREMLTGRVTLRTNPIDVFGQLLPGEPYLRAKRVIDTLVALPVLVAILPALALIALAIKLESPGSAVFRQRRVGYRGRVFLCYKFRTMQTSLEGPEYTLDDDPRITRLGRYLRQSRIDELPQIFNIIKGDMSWIGPRPESVPLARAYQKEIPFYAYRHTVRPGITGWAAVHQGNVALVDAARRKLEFDFYYIRYFSIWLDFLIVMMTIRTIISGEGSK